MAYDVAGLTYDGHDAGATVTSHGLQIAGISSTADSADLGGLEGGPLGADASKMTGIERRAFTSGITDEGQVCRIQDDSEDVGNYEQLLALSSDGTHRLAMADGNLIRLTAMPDGAEVRILNRETTSRTSTRDSALRPVMQHHQAQAELAGNETALAALLRFGQSLACDSVEDQDAWESCTEATFDIDDGYQIALQSEGGASNVLISDKIKESLFSYAANTYAQIALRKNDECTLTPVLNATHVAIEDRDASDGPIDHDFDGDQWTWCGGDDHWVDTTQDVDHCADCDKSVQPLDCADTICADGTPTIGTVDANQCAIGPGNDAWACYADSQYERIPVNYDTTKQQVNKCQQCDTSASNTTWTNNELPNEFYQCIAHHRTDDGRFPNLPSNIQGYAFMTGGSGSYNNVEFALHNYYTVHMCAFNTNLADDAYTRDVNNSFTWKKVTDSSRPKSTTYQWPDDFIGMHSRNHHSTDYRNFSEVRKWFFENRRITYLGQLNGEPAPDGSGGRNYYPAHDAATFYLKPGEEEWFVFYYNDRKDWQDRIGALVQFDGNQLDLEVNLHFACANDGKNDHPRMDGFMDCGAEGHGNKGDKRSALGVECGPVTGSGYDRSSYCKATNWIPYNELPWTMDGGDSWIDDVPSDWGASQGGIYVEGHIDCGKSPDDNSSDRDGWAFVKVKRKDNNANVCTPITLRNTWFHHNREIGFTNCW